MELYCRIFVALFLLTFSSAFDYRRVADHSDNEPDSNEHEYPPRNSLKSGQIMKPIFSKIKAVSTSVSHVEHPLPPTGIPSRVIMAKMASIKSSHEKKIEDTSVPAQESLEKHSMEITEKSAEDDDDKRKDLLKMSLPILPEDDSDKKKSDDIKVDVPEKFEDTVEKENDMKGPVHDELEDKDDLTKKPDIDKDIPYEKEIAFEKDDIDAKLKEDTLEKLEVKDEVQHDLKDAVVEAFHHNLVGGDRKEYFKLAVSKMSKESLADLHAALLHVLQQPEKHEHDEDVKVEEVKEDLKQAVHELEEEMDDGKKDALVEIEHVLEEEIKPRDEKIEGHDKELPKEDFYKSDVVGGVVTKDLHEVLNAKERENKEDVKDDVEVFSTDKMDHSKEELKHADVEEIKEGKLAHSKEELKLDVVEGSEIPHQKIEHGKEELKREDILPPPNDKADEKKRLIVDVPPEKVPEEPSSPIKPDDVKEEVEEDKAPKDIQEDECEEDEEVKDDMKEIDDKVVEDAAANFKQDDDVPIVDNHEGKVGDVKVIKGDSDDAYHDTPDLGKQEHKEVVVKEESKEIEDIPKSQYHGPLHHDNKDEQEKDGEIKEVPVEEIPPPKESYKKEDVKKEEPVVTTPPEVKKEDVKEPVDIPSHGKKDLSVDKDVEIFHELTGVPKESITEKIEPEKASREASSGEEKSSSQKPVDEEPNKSYESLEDKSIVGFVNKMGKRHKDWGIDKEIGGRRCRRHHNHQHYFRSTRLALRRKRAVPDSGENEVENFPPPSRLRLPMRTAFRQINSAAPPDPYQRAKSSLSLPLLTIIEPGTDRIMRDIKEGLQYVLQTSNEWTLALHGTGTTGMHASIDNLLEAGDKIVVFIHGYWGGLMANMSERVGAEVVRIHKAPGERFTLDEIETALRIHRPQAMAIVMGESSTSVRQPLDGIGELCERNNVLLIVDVVAVAGIQPVLMDKYKIDAAFASGHKGLGAVAGMAAISFSPRAVEKVLTRASRPKAYQTDMLIQAGQWNTSNPNRARTQSLSLPLMYAMREALATMADEKIENTYRRHEETTEQLQRGLVTLGLQSFVPDPNDRMVGITAVYPPQGKDVRKIYDYMFRNYNIEISTGFGPTAGQVLRLATFATNADRSRVNNLLRALKHALNSPETNI